MTEMEGQDIAYFTLGACASDLRMQIDCEQLRLNVSEAGPADTPAYSGSEMSS